MQRNMKALNTVLWGNTVGQFVLFDGENCEGKTVYLDALDESRSRSGDTNTVEKLVRIVRSLGRPKMRRSCRAADWLGNTDLQIFHQLAQDNSFLVLRLEPLTEAQILHIAQSRFPGDAQHFYQEAIKRGLEALITNPQTLLMLLSLVANGIWPKTRRELYERSATLLLTEPNEKHTRKPLGQFEAAELLDAAGAASASILISGLPGLSLRPNTPDADYRSYRHVPFDDPQKVEAALCRRAFVTVADEQVTYSHRTVAEFLAARWLVKKLQQGLPLGHIQSLFCIEGVPAPELRGLHAWLATLSPVHAPMLLAADPYGVLVYGDAASMAPSLRKALLQALQRLAQSDPWFRANDWTDKPLGGLSGPDPDMVELFRAVLADATSGFHLRSVVLDAIRNGPEIPELRNDLLAILADSACLYTERDDAFNALLHVIPGGVHDVVIVFRDQLVGDRSTARLRAHILAKLYPDCLTTDDIVAVCDDILNDPKEHASGELWELTSMVPERYLPEIISALCSLLVKREGFYDGRRNRIEIEWAFTQLLHRFLTSHLPKYPGEVWPWLSALYYFRGRTGDSLLSDAIKAWLQEHPSLVLSMSDIAIEQVRSSETRKLLRDFLRTVLSSISNHTLIAHIVGILEKKNQYNDKDCEIYQFGLSLCFWCDYEVIDLFERLYTLGNHDKVLNEKRDALCVSQIEEWHRQDALSKLEYAHKRRQRQEQTRLNLYATAESIRTGQHLYNLGILAQVYFGMFSDLERNGDPVTRLKNEIGNDLTEVTLEGFQAVLLRHALLSPAYIAELSAENRHYTWWYAILAGMDEKWHLARCLDVFPEAALEAALCLAFELSTSEYDGNTSRPTTREWPDRILTERPELARRVFRAFLHPLLENKVSHSRMLHELVSNEKTQPWCSALALELLEEFSSTPPDVLKNLLYAALAQAHCWTKLAILAKQVLMTPGRVRGEQRALWIVTGYLVSPDDFRDMLAGYTRNREEALWTVKELVESIASYKQGDLITLTIVQRQFLVWLIGRRFGYANRPIGEIIQGNRHGWNAAEFVRWQIEALSAEPSEKAGEALVALASNKKLASYRDHLRHAIANQAKIRRLQQYTQPDWDKTVETLREGQPANSADLYALAIDHLRTLCSDIRHSNIDIYKQFWELSRSGSIKLPLHEEVCRDRLIGLLTPRLSPLGIFAEPEGHMAADKRADIVLYHGSDLKLPIEVKRHTHKDLWTACEHQLDHLYARDPHAAGFGIYLVFWFGEDRGGPGPAPPQGMARPDSATALEQALRSRIPEDKTYCLEVIVLDVTPPAAMYLTKSNFTFSCSAPMQRYGRTMKKLMLRYLPRKYGRKAGDKSNTRGSKREEHLTLS
jgi:hypothetical protein